MPKRRLDQLLVSRGLADTEVKARAMIMAGEVKVAGHIMSKPGSMVPADADIGIAQKKPFVSRGGLKLAHALDMFGLDVKDYIAMDVGASTGGFTDCLLQRGAARVYAIDVGYGQLDYRLRQDPRVVVMDRINAHFTFELGEKVDLAAIDVSFISLTRVVPNVVTHLKAQGLLLLLFKPQFEALRDEVGAGGIIRDPMLHVQVLARFFKWAIMEQGLNLRDMTVSPIRGAQGNREFLILLRLP